MRKNDVRHRRGRGRARRPLTHAAMLLLLAAAGCASRLHLAEPHLNRIGDEGAARLQVYTAGRIELSRLVGSRDDLSVSDRHRLRFEQGEYVDEIRLKRNTPGAIVSSLSTETLVVSFEPPDETGQERTLTFKRVDATDPPVYWLWDDERDRFVCNAEKFRDWRSPPTYLEPCSSSVVYGGLRYEVDLRDGHLDIEKEFVDDSRIARRTVIGRRLP